MIQVTGLSKVYEKTGKKALDNASFSLSDGEMVGLIGSNGAGKSTLMKTMCKFLKPTSGNVRLDGIDIYESKNSLKNFGILLEPVFFDQLTAFENLEYYLKIHKKDEFIKDIEAHLEMVGLGKNKSQKPKEFSFGMKQRLGLAMALVGRPKILLLDEPFVGLDPNGIGDLIKILKERVEIEGMSAIISSHQLYELSSLCERTIVINSGQIVFDGSPELSPTITFELDRKIDTVLDGEVNENKLSSRKTGKELSNLISEIIKDYNIMNISKTECVLEQFFKEA